MTNTRPNLFKPVSDLHPTVDVRGPLNPTLGLSIAGESLPRPHLNPPPRPLTCGNRLPSNAETAMGF